MAAVIDLIDDQITSYQILNNVYKYLCYDNVTNQAFRQQDINRTSLSEQLGQLKQYRQEDDVEMELMSMNKDWLLLRMKQWITDYQFTSYLTDSVVIIAYVGQLEQVMNMLQNDEWKCIVIVLLSNQYTKVEYKGHGVVVNIDLSKNVLEFQKQVIKAQKYIRQKQGLNYKYKMESIPSVIYAYYYQNIQWKKIDQMIEQEMVREQIKQNMKRINKQVEAWIDSHKYTGQEGNKRLEYEIMLEDMERYYFPDNLVNQCLDEYMNQIVVFKKQMDQYIQNKKQNEGIKEVGVVDTTIKSYCKMMEDIHRVGADPNDYQQYLDQILKDEFMKLMEGFNKQYQQLVVRMVADLDRQWGRSMQQKVNEQIGKDYQMIKQWVIGNKLDESKLQKYLDEYMIEIGSFKVDKSIIIEAIQQSMNQQYGQIIEQFHNELVECLCQYISQYQDQDYKEYRKEIMNMSQKLMTKVKQSIDHKLSYIPLNQYSLHPLCNPLLSIQSAEIKSVRGCVYESISHFSFDFINLVQHTQQKTKIMNYFVIVFLLLLNLYMKGSNKYLLAVSVVYLLFQVKEVRNKVLRVRTNLNKEFNHILIKYLNKL